MKIKQIELLTENLAETERFYVGILGLHIQEKSASKISLLIGDSSLVFRKSGVSKPVYHFAFTVPDNQLLEAEEWISARVAVIEYQGKNIVDFKNWNAKSLYFLDNNGNVLEFIARFSLQNQSDKPFQGSGIVSISELALVTEDVEALAVKLIEQHGLSYFEKQIQSENFSVIGDDEGLLILSGSKRNWFPTDVRAESFWAKVVIENKGKLIEIEHDKP